MRVEQLDNGKIMVSDSGASGTGDTREEAEAYLHCFEAADAGLPWNDEDEDARADKRDRLTQALCAVVRSHL